MQQNVLNHIALFLIEKAIAEDKLKVEFGADGARLTSAAPGFSTTIARADFASMGLNAVRKL